MSAELRFQVADVYGTHRQIITNLTMLVMFVLVSVHANAESRMKGYYLVSIQEHRCHWPDMNPKEVGSRKRLESLVALVSQNGRQISMRIGESRDAREHSSLYGLYRARVL